MSATVTTAARKGGRRALPIDQTASGYAKAAPPPSAVGDAPYPKDLALYSPEMLQVWEVGQAQAAVYRFEAWLYEHLAANRIPLDDVMPVPTLLVAWIWCEMLERIFHPERFEIIGIEDDEPEEDGPRTDEDAADHGLTVVAPPERTERKALLPGCQRNTIFAGPRCTNLRAYGDRFCPACAKEYLKLARQG